MRTKIVSNYEKLSTDYLVGNIIWMNIAYTFFLITVNLKQPTVGQKHMTLCKLSITLHI